MKYLAIVIGLLFTGLGTTAQQPVSFPRSFIGHWKGTLQWYSEGPKPKTVNMELHIQPSKDSAGQYTWHIIYGKATQDSRAYLLKPVDSIQGHWVIDEANGILLDQYWKGGKLTGVFTVKGSTIVCSYWLEKGQLRFECFSYLAQPLTTSGHGTTESPKVDSYHIRSYQQAVLRKK